MDALGNPTHFHLTEGQVHDVTQATLMLKNIKNANVLADRGYDSNEVVEFVRANGCNAVIPPRACRTEQRAYDKHLYKDRCLVENLFQKLKRSRRIAMRFEKLARNYLSMVQLGAILIWLA